MAFAGSAAGSDRTSFLDRPLWNTRTEAVEFPFLFQIAVTGGSRGNKDAADAAVRDVLVEQFPSYITGGTGVGAGYAAEAARPRSRRPTPWPLDPEIVQQQLRSRSLSQQVQRCLQVNVSTSDMVTLLADIDEHLGAHSQSAHGDVTQLVASRARLVRHLLLQQDPQTPSGAETSRVHRTMRLLAPERVAAGTPFTAQVTLDAMPALATPDATAPAEVRFCMVAPGCSFPDGENSQLLRVPTNGPAEAAFFRLLLEDPSMATLPLRCEVWCGSTLVRTLDCEVGVKSPGRLGAQKTLVSVDPTADDEATLTVTASTFGDRTIFTVQGTGMVPQSEAIETSRIRAWLRDRLTEVGPHLRGEDPDAGVSSPARADLDGLGIELWKRVAPEAFRSQFAALRSRFGERFRSIFIYTDDPTVPWELMRPDGADGRAAECLGITHRIGRWHRFGDNRARQSPRKRLTLRDLAVLAPAYPATAQLPAQRREVDFLAAQPGYRAVPATFQGLQAVLSDLPPGIVHFAGHGKATRVGATESYAMVMQDREVTPLAWRGIAADASANGTLFFFNACDMGRGESVGSFVDGFAATIADLGSCGCVAATCRVADAGAAMFAIEFYRRVCSARPGEKVLVAEALRAARAECLNQGFATGLAFVFYGDPDLEVVR